MSQSEDLFKRAIAIIPGGVNSPVRAFKGVGGSPVFMKKGIGPFLFDIQDKQYIDYVCTWGATILGHAHPVLLKAVQDAAKNGFGFGTPTEAETLFAEKIQALMPSLSKIRLVNSGTEACMTAIRLARGYTQRSLLVKFEGCYHGHADALLVKAGSGALTLGIPSSSGVPINVASLTLTLPYNHLEKLEEAFQKFGSQIAGVIVEPIAGNMNCVLPIQGFLQTLRNLCDKHNSLLIFDEVMTGFRVARGGAQALFGVTPDLTTLGKVIGGGLPIAALGGKQNIMDFLAPTGPVYQAGTLSGNPLAVAVGSAVLEIIAKPGFYEHLSALTETLTAGLVQLGRNRGIPLSAVSIGGMFGFFFSSEQKISNLEQVLKCDLERFKLFFQGMLKEGVYCAPSAFEAGFVMASHTLKEIELTLGAADRVLKNLN